MRRSRSSRYSSRSWWGRGGGRTTNERQPHAPLQRRPKVQGEIEAHWTALPIARCERVSRLPDARGSRWRTGGEKEREFPAWWSHQRGQQRFPLYQRARPSPARWQLEQPHAVTNARVELPRPSVYKAALPANRSTT